MYAGTGSDHAAATILHWLPKFSPRLLFGEENGAFLFDREKAPGKPLWFEPGANLLAGGDTGVAWLKRQLELLVTSLGTMVLDFGVSTSPEATDVSNTPPVRSKAPASLHPVVIKHSAPAWHPCSILHC